MKDSQELKEIFLRGSFEGEIKSLEPMSNHTSLRIGGPADIFAVPRDVSSVTSLHAQLKRNNVPVFPLGGGTNVLIKDGGVAGVVLCLTSFRRIEFLRRSEARVYLLVEAGTLLQRLVNYAKEHGYTGIEGLAGIPGTVGGAIAGNAGAFGYEIKDVLASVEIIDAEGQSRRISADEITFGYRHSGIRQDEIILNAEITLGMGNPGEVASRIENFLGMKRGKQPIWERSAGCVFRNPAGFSAGKLIDEAGCKGMRVGDVEVSTVHANFFINKGKALAFDFISLMEAVARKVHERFGVVLEPEIKIIGRECVIG